MAKLLNFLCIIANFSLIFKSNIKLMILYGKYFPTENTKKRSSRAQAKSIRQSLTQKRVKGYKP